MPTGTPRFSIRQEKPDEADAIRRLHDATFGSPEEGGIVDGIRDTEDWFPTGSVVALEADRRLVGHSLLSRAELVAEDLGITHIGVIGPVAVLPELQRRGIGGALMEATIRAASELHLPVVCLVGHPDYYARFGFVPARTLGIEPPQPWGDPYWMALRLPAWRSGIRGRVRYPPAFPVD